MVDYGNISDLCVLFNGKNGITSPWFGTVTGCNVSENGEYHGIAGGPSCIIKNNIVRNNEGIGIVSQNQSIVSDNLCDSNKGGIYIVGNRSRITGNNCIGSGSNPGIEINGSDNKIEDNLVCGNGTGILCNPASGNFIAGNRASGNSADYNIAATNSYGPIVNETGGGVLSTTDPYANIRF